jgi:hypothetical protein
MSIRTRLVVLGAILTLAVVAPSSFGLTLVKDGLPVSAILVDPGANRSINAAAADVQNYIEKMSGAKLPIVLSGAAADTLPATLILVGDSPEARALGVEATKLPKEAYVIKTIGDDLVIVGWDNAQPGPAESFAEGGVEQCGTFYGSSAFLRDVLGVRWLWPGPTGEFVPKRATVEVGNLDITKEPFMKRRHMRMVYPGRKGFESAEAYFDMSQKPQLTEQEAVWYRRMGMGRSVDAPSGHSFTKWWGKYGSTNPDIFAMLKGGQRGPDGPADRVKMCVSNPKFWDIQIREFKGRKGHDLPASENDGSSGFCTCENCKAWDLDVNSLTPEQKAEIDQDHWEELQPIRGDGLPECMSNRYARWYNELAKRVREVDPQGYVTAYAYTHFRERPIGIKMEPNLLIGYIGFGAYPRSEEFSKVDRNHYLGWAQPGVRMYVRPNTPHYVENGMPFMVAHEMGEDLQWAMRNGAFMMDVDSMLGHWASWGPSYYVWIRQMSEGPDVEPQAIIDEWFDGFGPAEQQVRDYYGFWEEHLKGYWHDPKAWDRFQELGKMARRGGNRAGRLLIIAEHYPPESFVKAQALLDGAFAAAKDADPQIIEKLKNVEMSLKNGEMTARAMRLSLDALLDPAVSQKNMAELKGVLTELLAYRRQIATRNAVNVYWQMREELELGDVLHWDLIPANKQ